MNEDIGQMPSSSNPPSSSQAAKKLKGHGHPVRCMSVVRGPKHQSLLMTWEKTFQLVSLGGPSGQRSADAYQKVASWTSTFTATCIASNSSGITWVGYADGSVAVLQPRNGTLEPEKAQVMFNTSPTAITVSDETGEAWIGDSTGRLKVVHHRGYRIKHEKYAFDPDPDHPELSDILGKSRGSVACLLLVGQMAIIGLSCRRSTISVRSVKKAELLDVFDLKGSVVEPPTCLSQVPPEHGSRDGSTNIISGHAAGRVLLWKLQEGKLTLLAQLCKDIGGIRGIVYFPDLPVLLLGHDGGIISLLAMPQILQPPVISPPGTRPTPWPWHNVVLKVHRYGLVAFCASSDFVITSSYLGTVRAYPHSLLLAEAKKYGFKISRHYDVLTHTSVGDPDGWNVIRRGEGTSSSTAIFGQTSSEMAPHHSTRPPALPMDTSAPVSETSDPPPSSRSLMRSAHASRIHLTADLQALASQALPDDALPDDTRATRRLSAVGGRSGPMEARHSAIPARLEENGDVSVRGPRTQAHTPGGNTTPIEIPRHTQSPHGHVPGTPEPHVHNITNFGNLSPSSSSNLPNGGNMQALMAVHVDSEDHLAGLLQQTLSPGQIIQYNELGEMSYLGQGSYGTVHHAKWQGTEVAIKQLMNVKSLDDPQAHSFVSEVRMLQRVCHHPNVMRMCGVCLKPPMLVTQYYRNGPLVKLLTSALQGDAKSMKILTWQKRLSMLHDIATAMIHLHKQGIVHADLRTPNIFLTSDWKIQIGDFGLAREVGEMGSVRMSEPTHPRYRPPEVFKQMMWNPAADVWTFGVIMWEMLTWRPAAQMTMAHTAQVVLAAHNDPDSLRPRMPTEEDIQGKVGTGLDSYKDLMMVCLSMDPTNRPTFEHISSRLSNLLLWNTVKIQLVTAAHKQVLMLNAIKSMRPDTISDTQSLKSTPSETESDVGLNRKARDIIVAGVKPAGGAAAPPGLPPPQRPNAAPSALPYRKPDLEPFGPESLIAPDARGAPALDAPSSMLPRGEASGLSAVSATPASTTRDFMPTDTTARNAPHGRESESGSHGLRGSTDTEVPSPPMTPTKYSPFSQFSPGRSSPAASSVSRGANTPVSPRFSNQPSGIPKSPFLAWSPTSSPQPSPRNPMHSSTSTVQQQSKGSLTFQPASTMDQPANSIPPGSPYAAGINGPFHAFMDNISFSPQPSPRASAPTTPRPDPSLTGVSSQGTSQQPESSICHSISSGQRKAFDSTRLGSIKGLSPLPRLSSSTIKDHHQSTQSDKTSTFDRVAQNEYPLPLIIGMVTALQLAAPQTSSDQALECLKVMVSFRFQGDWAGVGVRDSTEQEGSGSPATSATSSSLTTPAPAPPTTPAPHGIGASSTPREADAQPPPAPMSATCNLLPSATIEEDETIYPVHYPTVDFATTTYADSYASLPSRSSRQSWPFEHLTTSGSNAAKLAEICDDVAREFNDKLRSSKDRSTSRVSSARNTDAFAAAYLEELDGPPPIFTPLGTRPPAPGPNPDSQPSEADPPSERSMQRSISKESPRPGSTALAAPIGLSLNVKKPAAVSIQPSASPPVTPTASPPPSPFSNSNNVFAVLAATQASPRNVGPPRLPTPERSPRPAPGSDKSIRPPWESNAAASPRPPSASQQPSQGSSQGPWQDGASGMFETPQTPGKSPRRTAPSWPNSASSWQEQQAAGPYSGLRPGTPPTDFSHNTASQYSGTSLSHPLTQPYAPAPPSTQLYAPPHTHTQDPHPFSSPGTHAYTQVAASGRRSHQELAGRPAGYPGTETHSPFSINNVAPRSVEPDAAFGFTPGSSAYASTRHPMAAGQTGLEAPAASTAQNGPSSPDSLSSFQQRVSETTTSSYQSDASRALFQQHGSSQGDDSGRLNGTTGRARQASNRSTTRELQDYESASIGLMNGRDSSSLYTTAGMGMTGRAGHARAPGGGVTSPPSPARAADWDRQQQQASRPMWAEPTGHASPMTHVPMQGYSTMAPQANAVQSPFNIIANQNANQQAMQSLGYDHHHGSLQADPRSPTSPQTGMVPTGTTSGRHDPNWRLPYPNFHTPNTQETHSSAPAALGYHPLERNPSSYSTQQVGTLTSAPSRTTSGASSLSRCGRLGSRTPTEAQLAAMQAVSAVDGFPVQYASAAGRAQTMDPRAGDAADSRAAASSRQTVAQPEQPSKSGSSFLGLSGIKKWSVNKQGKRSTMESSRR